MVVCLPSPAFDTQLWKEREREGGWKEQRKEKPSIIHHINHKFPEFEQRVEYRKYSNNS